MEMMNGRVSERSRKGHAMETLEAIKQRRSVRAYKPDMPAKELVEKVIEAGIWAPTGMGQQAPVIVAITDKALRDELSAMNAEIFGRPGTDPFYGAPVVLVVLADKTMPTHVYDGSLVMGNMMLAAYDLGLSSCWIHRAKEEFESERGKQILKQLGIEGDYEGIGHCILGYAADDAAPVAKPRKENWVYWAE